MPHAVNGLSNPSIQGTPRHICEVLAAQITTQLEKSGNLAPSFNDLNHFQASILLQHQNLYPSNNRPRPDLHRCRSSRSVIYAD